MNGPAEATRRPANLLGLDYAAEARRLGSPPVPIIDRHAHINGPKAAHIFRDVMDTFDVAEVHSMSILDQAYGVRDVLGDRIRFIGFPRFTAEDKVHAFTHGYLEDLRIWRDEFGATCAKIWNAPRWREIAQKFAAGTELNPADIATLDSPWRLRTAERMIELGLSIMVHTADPDTWFASRYADADLFGTKAEHHDEFERFLERVHPTTVIGAHLCGTPENLDVLDGFLARHDNLITDSSATKWVLREVSKHEPERVRAFFEKWRGRIIFGSDIVTQDAHLERTEPDDKSYGIHLASNRDEAFELYASRYWALRTLWETAYDGPSAIADPDLQMVDPAHFDALSAPPLRGMSLPSELLEQFYATQDAPHPIG